MLKTLEGKKDSLLIKEEKLMCLKSKALWLQEGDKNTKFFHMSASHRKNINTICEIRNKQGYMVSSLEDKVEVGVDFFQNIFKELEGCPIQEILEVLGFFPRMITEEMNEELTKEIYEEEISHILHTFQKGKIPRPDGFTLEFFIGFYDKIKEDLLVVVKESRKSGKVLGRFNSTFITLIPKK